MCPLKKTEKTGLPKPFNSLSVFMKTFDVDFQTGIEASQKIDVSGKNASIQMSTAVQHCKEISTTSVAISIGCTYYFSSCCYLRLKINEITVCR